MKVILIKDVKNLGQKNDIIEVSDGYFKNFLCKRQLAVLPTEAAHKQLSTDLNNIKAAHSAKVEEAKKLKDKIEKTNLHLFLKANNGFAFGKISQKQIIEEFKKHNIEITKYMFNDDFEPLKLGKFNITLNLFEDVKATFELLITQE